MQRAGLLSRVPLLRRWSRPAVGATALGFGTAVLVVVAAAPSRALASWLLLGAAWGWLVLAVG